jgi:hypothetical protein
MSQPPAPASLFANYLQSQAAAQAAGLAEAGLGSEVQPYEAGPVQPVDARPAWDASLAAAGFLAPHQDIKSWQPPPHWPSLVAGHDPIAALAFSLCNFPQLARDLRLLLQPEQVASPPNTLEAASVPALVDWTDEAVRQRRFPQIVLAVGALRLARHFDRAAEIVATLDSGVPAEWRAMWENEKAALAWHAGHKQEAQSRWQLLPPSAPVWFNRGMAALFLGNPAAAATALQEAARLIPETSPWYHLAQLYLALAGSRSR